MGPTQNQSQPGGYGKFSASKLRIQVLGGSIVPRRRREDREPEEADIELAPLPTPEQIAALHALQWRGPTPSTAPQAAMMASR